MSLDQKSFEALQFVAVLHVCCMCVACVSHVCCMCCSVLGSAVRCYVLWEVGEICIERCGGGGSWPKYGGCVRVCVCERERERVRAYVYM